jgi:hypothetical protein
MNSKVRLSSHPHFYQNYQIHRFIGHYPNIIPTAFMGGFVVDGMPPRWLARAKFRDWSRIADDSGGAGHERAGTAPGNL